MFSGFFHFGDFLVSTDFYCFFLIFSDSIWYTDIAEFYSTLFHEMVHSTGHKTRLDRQLAPKTIWQDGRIQQRGVDRRNWRGNATKPDRY